MNRSLTKNGRTLPKSASIAIGMIFLILISAAMPFASHSVVAGGLLVACAIFLFVTADKKIPLAITLFALFMTLSADDSFKALALILAVLSGTAILARLLDMMKLPVAVAAPILASVVAAVITRSLTAAILPLSFIIPAVALCYSFKKGEKRVFSICLTSAALLISFAITVFAALLESEVALNPSTLSAFSESLKSQLSELFLSYELSTPKGEIYQVFTELEAVNLAEALVSLVPAFLIISTNVIAFFSQKLLFNMALRAGEEKRFTGEMVALILSPAAGATFILSFFISTLTALSSDNALLTTVFDNLFIILLPGLAASGIMFKVAKIAHTRRGSWIIVPFALLAFVNISAALLLAAGMGAYYSIANPLSAYLRSRED